MKKRCYIILSHNPNGTISGYVEHSFSMGMSNDRVRVDRIYKHNPDILRKFNYISDYAALICQSNDTVNKLNKKELKRKSGVIFKAYKVGSKNCPVIIDWREISLMKQKKVEYKKFNWRNLPFKVKVKNENF